MKHDQTYGYQENNPQTKSFEKNYKIGVTESSPKVIERIFS